MKRILLLLIICFQFIRVSSQINELSREIPENCGIPSKVLINLFDSLTSLPKTEIHSVMVIRHGKVVGEIYPKPFSMEYKHTMYSCSKTFVSAAVGLAIAENRLALSDRVASFFPDLLPEIISDELASMTVKNLMTMTSGITPDWNMRNVCSDWIRTYLSKEVVTPGKKFQYDSICTYLLSAIVQKVTGMSLLDYLNKKLFIPMNISDVEWEMSPEGYNTGGWGLRIQSESLAKFGLLLLNNGLWNGKELIPSSWVKEMTSAHFINKGGDDYCYQMWKCDYPGAVRADGAFGQYIILIPNKDMVVVITQCTKISGKRQRHLVWDEVLPYVSDEKLKIDNSYKKLERKQTSYSLPYPLGAKCNKHLFNQFFNHDIILSENKLGWEKIRLYYDGKKVNMKVVNTKKEISVFDLGYRQWLKIQTVSTPPYSINPVGAFNNIKGPFTVAGSYACTANDKLSIMLHYVDWITSTSLDFTFNNEKVSINVKHNYYNNPYVINGVMEKVPEER